MQQHAMALKRRIIIDGNEIPGLVKFGVKNFEEGTLEVPEFQRTRVIENGITKYPALEMTYKIERGTSTLDFWRNYKFNKETHSITEILTDADGVEFSRWLHQDCKCVKYEEPETDLANPPYAQINIVVLPWDSIPLAAE